MIKFRLGDFITVEEKIDGDEFFGQLVEISLCEWGGYFIRLIDDAGNDATVHSDKIKSINGTTVIKLSCDEHVLTIEETS